MNLSRKVAFGSLAVSLAVVSIKGFAYQLTGSVALFSDALESIINVATAIAAVIAIRYAQQPPDPQHPYGHHKAEYLSAVLVGALIFVAGATILHEAYHGFLYPEPIDAPLLGVAVSSIATVLNVIWSYVLIHTGRKQRSPALVSDGKHLLADVVTSLGVVVGVGLVIATGVQQLDSVVAALVAVHVLWSGWEVIHENSGGLLDAAPPEVELKQINEIIAAHAVDAIEFHDVRARNAGSATFIDFHLVVPGAMSVAQSHAICDRLEAALKDQLHEPIVSIHVEPEDKAEHGGARTQERQPAR
ncbi:cation diffusion facilitator family transporter [uncultured Rhodoblastus sp.]|uniref:cation diffusion facilitator family transporter n=1 Tax=uncultured Rhodoblastus sp. TaxID=543037 RepID=UPI0025F1DAAB|nr:cation diffusion facilitator family transporter [uncultured Rhodoblastus sp.]